MTLAFMKNNTKINCQVILEGRAQNKSRKSIKIGLNWIILPGQSKLLKPLFEFISEVSISSGRSIDYLTLREDFSQTGSVISTQERDELKI